jgi:hypothetical protein
MYTKFPYDTTRRETIVNSDTNAGTEFVVATKQLEHLSQLAHEVRTTPEPWGAGVESSAVLGMNVIFESIPQKFPVQDLLNWLRNEINLHYRQQVDEAELTAAAVEVALGQLARLYAI